MLKQNSPSKKHMLKIVFLCGLSFHLCATDINNRQFLEEQASRLITEDIAEYNIGWLMETDSLPIPTPISIKQYPIPISVEQDEIESNMRQMEIQRPRIEDYVRWIEYDSRRREYYRARMGYDRSKMIEVLFQIPLDECETLITLSLTLITPSMNRSDRSAIIQALSKIPNNERETVIKQTLKLITSDMKADERIRIIKTQSKNSS